MNKIQQLCFNKFVFNKNIKPEKLKIFFDNLNFSSPILWSSITREQQYNNMVYTAERYINGKLYTSLILVDKELAKKISKVLRKKYHSYNIIIAPNIKNKYFFTELKEKAEKIIYKKLKAKNII